jgi:signal transduction histidine kinase
MISDLAGRAFMTIMAHYHIEPVAVESEFLAATHRILLQSSIAAVAVAMLLGWLLVRLLVRPLERMIVLAESVARGDYGSRVEAGGPDEVARLVDALNRMAASLQRTEALRRDLVANVAHELRTPLAGLQGYLEALREGVAEATPDTLAFLHDEVLRLVRLVDALHQLSQFDARVSRLRVAEIDLPALIRRVLDAYRPAFARRAMRLATTLGPGEPRVVADPDLVDQAVRNLLDNALRYAPDGAEVTVTTARRSGTVQVGVENTGDEIPAKDLARIFERFYRGEKSRSRDTGGVGIGLALVHEIAQAHGGRTGASSAAGRTTVWFTLACRTHATPAAAAS